MMTITVLGAGSWGATLGDLLSRKGHTVRLWDISPDVINYLAVHRSSPKLPHLTLHDDILLSTDLAQSLDKAQYVVVTVPSHAIRDLCKNLESSSSLPTSTKWVICSKGIEEDSTLTLSQVFIEVFAGEVKDRLCVLSGPSHAEEVSRQMPTTLTAAAYHPPLSHEVQQLFMTSFFRVYSHDDVLGVELGGALKNVIAIAAGACDGLQLGDNSKAALVTRGLAEIVRLSSVLGARESTFAGLAGIGDLIVTAYSGHSRNRNFGEKLAKGISVEQAQKEIGMVVEGIRTSHSAFQLSRKHEVQMPISEEVYRVIYEGKLPKQALLDLMNRSPKPEVY